MASTETINEQPARAPGANGANTLIHLDGVTKVFLTDEVETHALSGIHLDIRTGEYVSIAGPSGCGKSTLLSILGLLDTPSGGSYSLKGTEVANLSFPERARIRNREIGFIFQSFNLSRPDRVEKLSSPGTNRAWARASERFVLEALDASHGQSAKHFPVSSRRPQQRSQWRALSRQRDPSRGRADG